MKKRKQRGFIIDPFRFAVAGAALNPTASNVVFELHGDALPWVDAAYVAHGIANYAAVVEATIKPTFCTGSFSNPVAGGNKCARVAIGATSTDLQFGTGAWFMEAQFYTSTLGCRIFDTRSVPGQPGWVFGGDGSEFLYFQYAGTAYTATSTYSTSAWHHAAASYDGTDLRLFLDGVVVLTQTVALNITTGQHLAIGNTNDNANAISGQYLAEMRIVKGESVVTAGFTAPTARMSDAGSVSLALQTNVTYSNVVLRSTYDANVNDVSNAARTMTAAGGAAVSALQSMFGGSSLLLDGTGDYVSAADSTDFDMGTGDYQFQGWVRRNGAKANSPFILSCYTSATVGYSFAVNGTTHIPNFDETGDTVDRAFITALADVTWYHLAIGRKDSVFYSFVDGVLERFISDTLTANCAGTMFIGRLNNSLPNFDWLGNIDDIQLVKAECQLFKSFLVPTAALPVS